jgi:hypothetical protein
MCITVGQAEHYSFLTTLGRNKYKKYWEELTTLLRMGLVGPPVAKGVKSS